MTTYCVDITGKSGKVYGFHFECDHWHQMEAMADDISDNPKVLVIPLGELVLSIPIEEVKP